MSFSSIAFRHVNQRGLTSYAKCLQQQIRLGDERWIKSARSRINMDPPKIQLGGFVKTSKIAAELASKQQVLRQNMELMTRISGIQRVMGSFDSFNRVSAYNSRMNAMRAYWREVEHQNHFMGCRLLRTKSVVDTRNKRVPPPAKPNVIRSDLHNRSTLKIYENSLASMHVSHRLARKLLRPLIFFDYGVRNIRTLGRIIIQLYTEASPEVVLELVRACTFNERQRIKTIRIFPDLWLETELNTIGNDATENHYQRHLLNAHGGPGVLSYSMDYRHSFPQGLINFAISFRQLSPSQLKRIAFGYVRSGLGVLRSVMDYGTKFGKTKKIIEVLECGLL